MAATGIRQGICPADFYNGSMTTNLQCPICKHPLHLEGKTFQCPNRHSFDKARQGYVNLSRKQKAGGDNREMVQARTAFLEKEYYDFLKQEILERLKEQQPDVLVDLGCGQGWYTRDFAAAARESFGIDLSKDAIQYAAAHDKKTQYIVGSIYDLPFEDESVDTLVSIFTPIPAQEALRVLKPGGSFLIAGPGARHHHELKDVLYETVLENDPPAQVEGFDLKERKELFQIKHVANPMELLDMTPYRYKSSKEAIERVKKLDGLDVNFDFIVSDWRKPE